MGRGWFGESYRHYLAAKGYFVARNKAKWLTVYHGTQRKNLDSIREKGLDPRGPGFSGAQVPIVALTPSLSTAVAHAERGPETKGLDGQSDPVVLKVKITPEEAREGYATTNIESRGDYKDDFEGYVRDEKLKRLKKAIPSKFYTYEFGIPKNISSERISVVNFEEAKHKALKKYRKIDSYALMPKNAKKSEYLPQSVDISVWKRKIKGDIE
jgi:hypothetical protein